MERTQLPPEIMAVLAKAETGLSRQDRAVLQGFLIAPPPGLDPRNLAYVESVLQSAPEIDPTGMVTAETPGIMDVISPAADQATIDATLTELGHPPPGAPDVAETWRAAPELNVPSLATVGELSTPRTITSPLGAGVMPDPIAETANLPGVGGNALNTEAQGRGRRGENWRAQPEALLEPIAADSAFAGILPENLGMFSSSPTLTARRIAESRGGGELTAAGLAPYAQSALTLSAMGALGGDTGLRDLSSGPASNAAALGAAEDWLGQMGMGASGDPRAIYREVFRRARRTDPATMDTGQGEAGDVYNQIDVTNGALMAAAPFMTGAAQEGLANRLQAAASDYLMAYAEGSTTMSYPDYLKSIGAKRWLGRP